MRRCSTMHDNTLQELQRWYLSQCNGDWEHGYGVEIGTLDNPGWHVVVNLTDTPLAEKQFTEVKKLEHETDWIQCRVHDGKFEGHGGPLMLEEILRVFLAWATE
ncbi:MAG TPA: immunity 53 family protein [Candidatus Acidoferrales bacterium]|nr:immunity 53 family protein [Candidatus Acidoferrales bacterium]